MLEESENEQWQGVISKKSKLKLKKLAHDSLVSVENNICATPRRVIEVKDKLGEHQSHNEHRSCRTCHAMFSRVKLDRTSATKKCIAANGEMIKHLGEKTIPFKSVEGVHRSIKFRSASIVKCKLAMSLCWMKRTRTFETIETALSSSWA